MTEPSPIPACLSHLTQRDAAGRARALEDAACIAQVILDNVLSRPQPLSGFDAGLCLGATRARDYIRSLIPTPPAPAPDDSAIRAELIAALREVMALVPRLEHVPSRAPYAKILAVMARGRAALERAGDLP